MRTSHIAALFTLLYAFGSMNSAIAGGRSGACSPPKGEITILPNQKCDGKYTFGLGKDVELSAINLKDKDCKCGAAVQDSINPKTGVRWGLASGVVGKFKDGKNGAQKTWTAANDPIEDLQFTLQLNDAGPKKNPNAYEDGDFVEVAKSESFDVVIPNEVTTEVTPGSCPTNSFGAGDDLSDTVNRKGCEVDFKDCFIRERVGVHNKVDGCLLVSRREKINTGTDNTIILATNVAERIPMTAGNDAHYTCALIPNIPGGPNCLSFWETVWEFKSPQKRRGWQMFTRKYSFQADSTGKYNNVVLYREIVSYP